jgi:hypothetical protein
MTGRRSRALVVTMGLLLGASACGDDGGEGTATTTDPSTSTTSADTTTASSTTSTTATPVDPLPPAAAADLEPIYGAALAELGLRLTDRGGLIDRTGGGYVPSAEGTHLALYVEPTGDRTIPQYIDGIRGVAVVFGDVFERWPGLVSYDVCQEPMEAYGESASEPLPVTQIELTREEAEAIDWDTVSVVDLVRASLADPPGLALRVSSRLARDPAYVAVVDSAS